MKNKEKMKSMDPFDEIKGLKTPDKIKKRMNRIHKKYGKILKKLANE